MFDNLPIFFDFVVYVSFIHIVEDVGEFADQVAHDQETREHQQKGDPEGRYRIRCYVMTHHVEKSHEYHDIVLEHISFLVVILKLNFKLSWENIWVGINLVLAIESFFIR